MGSEAVKRQSSAGKRHLALVEEYKVPRIFQPPIAAAASFYRIMDKIEHGFLRVTDPYGQERTFGVPGHALHAHLQVNHPDFFKSVVRGGAMGLGESYMDGWWSVADDQLLSFLGIVMSNRLQSRVRMDTLLILRLAWERLRHTPYFLRSAKKSIQKHYDLGNDFFELMLDESMTYSCGYQQHPDDTLEQMQQQKYELIARKLGLQRGGALIDIGCGWGGMLRHAATQCDQIVGAGITLSENQYTLGRERLAQAGVSDRVDIHLRDYRNTSGSYDFFVSIGMFEHVGRQSYATFMRKAAELLKPDGVGLLHTMATVDALKDKTDPWITKYIFPGGRMPRLEEIAQDMRRADLAIAHVENLRPHYAETMRHWRHNFNRNRSRVLMLSPRFDQRFMRMWDYFLQACEAAFRYGNIELYQLVFTKGRSWSFPMQLRY